jgi:formamidopyrimidine-DNA glycosylase
MPELPEVETVKNELSPRVLGERITNITLTWDGIVKEPSVSKFRHQLIGQIITEIFRRGKYLFFRLSSNQLLVIHLKMTGSLLFQPLTDDPERFIRAIIHLDGGTGLYFRDPRKFGALRLINDANHITSKLGPEPLVPSFSPEVLLQRLAKRKASIKALLLDQKFVAGIGNMYADEILFTSKIHPLRLGGNLNRKEVLRLHQAIQQVLRAGISNKGASERSYFLPSGDKGTAHFHFQVAHRGNQECFTCGTLIQRLVLRSRGTYFCPTCQR